MFDSPILDSDEAPWSESDYVALAEWQIAVDPEVTCEIAAADVVAAAQTAPVTAGLFADLSAVDRAQLDSDGCLELSAAWQRIANHVAARIADAVAGLLHATPSSPVLERERIAAADVATALGLGMGAADQLLSVSAALSSRLTATREAALAGEVSWTKAATLANATMCLTAPQAQQVEARVLPRAAARTPARHREAVRTAVDRVDPDGVEDRRKKAKRDIALIREHHAGGMGELFATMPSEQLDEVWTGADVWARAHKAKGDERTLDQLRVGALVQWGRSYLTHGDPTYCDRHCDEPEPARDVEVQKPADAKPVRHGRAAALRVAWDLSSLLGLTAHSGRVLSSGALLPPAAMREMMAGGVRLRRMLIDPDTGELVDLTPVSWLLAPTDGAAHAQPIVLGVITTAVLDDLPADIRDAVAGADPVIAAMLAHPITADDLDSDPGAEQPSAPLAEFVAVRDGHPVNPTAGPTDAAAADIDHTIARRDGGKTVRDNLASLTRRWHRLKTHGGWTVRRVGRQWEWTSPAGRVYVTGPYDYRSGP